MESTTPAESKTCSKCEKKPASNGNAWCRECRSAHELDRQKTKAIMERAQSFQQGAQAIRESLARAYARVPGAMFEGTSIAQFIWGFPSPTLRPEESAVDVKDLAG